jgi:hypothetical protein
LPDRLWRSPTQTSCRSANGWKGGLRGQAAPKRRHGLLSQASYKRLEDGRFQWPKIENGVMRLSPAQLFALVEGLDWKRVSAVKETPAPRLPG